MGASGTTDTSDTSVSTVDQLATSRSPSVVTSSSSAFVSPIPVRLARSRRSTIRTVVYPVEPLGSTGSSVTVVSGTPLVDYSKPNNSSNRLNDLNDLPRTKQNNVARSVRARSVFRSPHFTGDSVGRRVDLVGRRVDRVNNPADLVAGSHVSVRSIGPLDAIGPANLVNSVSAEDLVNSVDSIDSIDLLDSINQVNSVGPIDSSGSIGSNDSNNSSIAYNEQSNSSIVPSPKSVGESDGISSSDSSVKSAPAVSAGSSDAHLDVSSTDFSVFNVTDRAVLEPVSPSSVRSLVSSSSGIFLSTNSSDTDSAFGSEDSNTNSTTIHLSSSQPSSSTNDTTGSIDVTIENDSAITTTSGAIGITDPVGTAVLTNHDNFSREGDTSLHEDGPDRVVSTTTFVPIRRSNSVRVFYDYGEGPDLLDDDC